MYQSVSRFAMPLQRRHHTVVGAFLSTCSCTHWRIGRDTDVKLRTVALKQRQFRAQVIFTLALWLCGVSAVAGHVHHQAGQHSEHNHRHGSHGCGSDAPHVQALEKSAPFVPVRYDTPNAPVLPPFTESDSTRRLQSSYVNIEAAEAAGITRPVRIFVREKCLAENFTCPLVCRIAL